MEEAPSVGKRAVLRLRSDSNGSATAQKKLDEVALTAGSVFFANGVLGAAGIFVPESKAVPLLVFGSIMFLGAYLRSVISRVGGHYGVWPWVD